MKYITSADNNLIKIAASLKEKKYRQKYGLYVIEGWRAVKDAVEAGAEIECVFAEEGQQFDLYDATQEVYIVPSRLMEKICGTATPQGIAALARIKTPKLGALSWCLVLDRLSDPGNLGTIIRTAAACGVRDIILCGCADPYNPKCVRATMGGLNYVNLFEMEAEKAIDAVKGAGIPLLCADMGGKNIFERKKQDNFALVIGSEAHGMGEAFLKACDEVISLPMRNVESLNAAVCASVMMYLLIHS
jgi:TrmH family RNA methyltransferase